MASTQTDRLGTQVASVPNPPVRVFTSGATCVLGLSDAGGFVEINAGNISVTCTLPATGGPYTIVDGAGVATAHPITIKNAGGTTVGTITANGFSAQFAWDGTKMVQIIPSAPAGGTSPGGSNTQVQYNNGGAFAGTSAMTVSGSTITITTLALTNTLTVANGGTGLTTLATGSIPIGAGTSAMTALSPTGQNGKVISSNGTSFVMSTPAISTTFTSSQQAIPANGSTLTLAHGLSAAPAFARVLFVNVSADSGWNGETIDLGSVGINGNGGLSQGAILSYDATNLYLTIGSNRGIAILNKSTGGVIDSTGYTAANWRVVLKAWL